MTQDIDIDKLSEEQKSGRDSIQSQVNTLKGATLIAGEQNGNSFTYRFLGNEIPKTLTDITAQKNGDKWEVTKAVTSSTVGGLDQGNRVTTKRTFTKGGKDFGAALITAGI